MIRLGYARNLRPHDPSHAAKALTSYAVWCAISGRCKHCLFSHHAALRASADMRCGQTPAVLKLLYDEDLVEEDYLQAWSSKPTAAKILEVCAPWPDQCSSFMLS